MYAELPERERAGDVGSVLLPAWDGSNHAQRGVCPEKSRELSQQRERASCFRGEGGDLRVQGGDAGL